MRAPLKKVMFHLAWSPDSLPTSEAISPLLEYLDIHLTALNESLLPENFNRALREVWEVVLAELSGQMDGSTGVSLKKYIQLSWKLGSRVKNLFFFVNSKAGQASRVLRQTSGGADLLVSFINADDKGLSYEKIQCDAYFVVEKRLEYHKMDTTLLIDEFYRQRLQVIIFFF